VSVKRLVPLHAVALLDHVHTYDGNVFSVSESTVGSTGTLDGGNPFSEFGNLPGNLDAGEA